MQNFDFPNDFKSNNLQPDDSGDEVLVEQDILMEQILDNINNTPLGQVLKRMAELPEVRREKVLSMRQQLSQGQYDLNERLDSALDKVLEELAK